MLAQVGQVPVEQGLAVAAHCEGKVQAKSSCAPSWPYVSRDLDGIQIMAKKSCESFDWQCSGQLVLNVRKMTPIAEPLHRHTSHMPTTLMSVFALADTLASGLSAILAHV